MKARPIASYTRTWITALGNLLSMALNAIAKTVFTQDDFLATVPSILRTVWQVMHSLHHHFDLTLEQQDIAGFYNAVPHSRALQSAQILIARFRRLQDLTDPNAFLSVSSQSATRLLDSSLSRQVEASSASHQPAWVRPAHRFFGVVLLRFKNYSFVRTVHSSCSLRGSSRALFDTSTIEHFFLLIL